MFKLAVVAERVPVVEVEPAKPAASTIPEPVAEVKPASEVSAMPPTPAVPAAQPSPVKAMVPAPEAAPTEPAPVVAKPPAQPAPLSMDDAVDEGLDDDAMMGLLAPSSEPDTQTVDFLDDPGFADADHFDPVPDPGMNAGFEADMPDAPAPVKTPAIALDAFTPDHWVEVSAQLMKQGIDHHILKDTEWIGVEDGTTVLLKTPHKMVKQLSFVGTVQTLLSDYFQTPLKVVFVQGETENTALEAERRAIVARQQKAETDAQQDPRVQQFIRTFDGQLCHDTVQPL